MPVTGRLEDAVVGETVLGELADALEQNEPRSRRALIGDPGLRKAIASLLFCAVAATVTSYIRAPIVIWPLGIAMLGAMLFLVWTMHGEAKRKRT